MQKSFNGACSAAAELKALGNAIRRCVNAAGEPEDMGLTGGQSHILLYLYLNRGREVYQRDVEAEFNIRRSTATRLLQAMEHKGFITRESARQDGRLKRLVLTPMAETYSAGVEEHMRAMEDKLLHGVTSREREEFRRICAKILANAEAMGGTV